MSGEPLSAADGTVAESLVPPATPSMPATTAAPEATATTAVEPLVPTTAARPTGRRHLMLRAGLGRLIRFMVTVALFVGGVTLGYASFQSNQPVVTPPGDPVTAGAPTPAEVVEVIAAIASNDADSIRAAVPGNPYKLLTSELQRWEFQEVTSVETLSTYVDGPRSSTEIVLVGRTTNGSAISINLVVHADGGEIVSFR